MRNRLAGILALLFMRKQKDPIKVFTCHRCPKQITFKTMCMIVDDYHPVCADCAAAAMTEEQHRCDNYDLL